MNTQHGGQASMQERRSIPLQWWLLSVGVLLIAALGVLYARQNAPARTLSNSIGTIAPTVHTVADQKSPPSATAVETPRMDAGTQGTMNYIRVHKKIPDWEILHYFRADQMSTY